MNKTKIVSHIDFGDALIAACEIVGPYRIIAASLRLESSQSVRVGMERDEDTFHRIFGDDRGNATPAYISSDEIHTAKKSRIFVELSKIIAIQGGQRGFIVSSIDPDIPDEISISMQYMPRGSLIEEPIFDGGIM